MLATAVPLELPPVVVWVAGAAGAVMAALLDLDQVRRELTSESRNIDRRLAHVESRLWKGGNRDDGRDRAAED